MKKFLLVTLIGMALTIYVYGVVTDLMEAAEKAEAESEVATVVYVE